ncbi:GAF domain-containing sensor histidine kinase [Kordiimonas sp.]|uniref:GAF domain-containing sensor histidine kinase n=1 Tax=Kordiimonas sp. TaxID=1970157 RepID=UPI003B52B0D2
MSARNEKSAGTEPLAAFEGITHLTGKAYFQALCKLLAEHFGADIAYVSLLSADHMSARTLAHYEHGASMPPTDYPLDRTPCWETVNKRGCFYESAVRETYTKDAYLEEHEIEGYVGFPLIGEDPKRVEGTLIAMSKTAIPEDGALHTVMKLARSRTQAELVHTQYENKLKETISQALLLNYSKSMFMANIGHELRTPLGAMVGYASLIRDGQADKTTISNYANSICSSGEELLALISDIMSLAMLEISDETSKREKFDLLDIARTGRRLIQQQAASKNLTVAAATRSDALIVHGDAGHTKKALMNLLSNAVKFTSNGKIEIVVEEDESSNARLSVIDGGVGMSPGEIAKATEPLGTFTHAYDMHQEGAGLGLPITALLMQRQGGELLIESEKGKGTKAHLIFPRSLVQTEEGDFI